MNLSREEGRGCRVEETRKHDPSIISKICRESSIFEHGDDEVLSNTTKVIVEKHVVE